MILAGLLKFALLVGMIVGVDKVSYHPPLVPHTTEDTGQGQRRYRPDDAIRHRVPRYELVLSELGQARLYSHAGVPWIHALGQYERTDSTVAVYGCTLLVRGHRLTDYTRCLPLTPGDSVVEWVESPVR